MTDPERLSELKELQASSGNILSGAYRFNEWTGRVSGLLEFDPVARKKFDALCDYIHNEQDGGKWQLYENVIQAEVKMQAVVARAISDLEINRNYLPLVLPESFSIPDPVVIPDASGFGQPEIEITRNSEDMPPTPKRLVPECNFPLPAERDIPKRLTKDHGLFWLVMHAHWMVRVKALLFFLAVFGFGVQSAQNHVFMQVWTWTITPITELMKLLTK